MVLSALVPYAFLLLTLIGIYIYIYIYIGTHSWHFAFSGIFCFSLLLLQYSFLAAEIRWPIITVNLTVMARNEDHLGAEPNTTSQSSLSL